MKKFSLNRLLHNDRAMIVLSLIAAIAIWYTVISGPANIVTQSFTVRVSAADIGNGDLHVFGLDTFDVEVEVEGTWAVVSRLSANDLRARLDTSDIQGPGNRQLTVVASRSSGETGYDILKVTPSTVTAFCDYWEEKTYTVTGDLPNIKPSERCLIGETIVDRTILPTGDITIKGPQSIVQNITQVVARTEEEQTISDVADFPAELLALDAHGNEVDLTYCTMLVPESSDPDAGLIELTDRGVQLTVSVDTYREITFTYQTLHQPAGMTDLSDFITVSPPTLTLIGNKAIIEQYADELANLGTIDFDQLSPDTKQVTKTLNLPDGIRAENNAVTISFDWQGYTSKTVTLDLSATNSPVTFRGLPAGKTATPLVQSLSVTLVGPSRSLRSLTAKSLSITVTSAQRTAVS
jgi:hypothetical protein